MAGILCAAIGISCVKPSGSPVAIDYLLEGKQHEAFHAIVEQWRLSIYHGCIADSGLTMSCADCTAIFMVVRITIDRSGRMRGYTKIKENVCGHPAPEKLERCFMEYLESVTFPGCLRDMTIETRLGTGLKC